MTSRTFRSAAPPLCLAALLVALAAPAAAQTRYIAFGDSVTAADGFDDPSFPCPSHCGYPGRLEDLLQGAGEQATVVNAGLGGEKTPEGLTRLDQVLADQGGDVLLLMEGTNDISVGISVETTIFDLKAMADKATSQGLTTVHATVIPRIPDAKKGDGDNVITRQLDWRIRDVAHNQSRKLADNFEVFDAYPNHFQEIYHPGGDAVGHPNAAGFDLMAHTFFDVLQGTDSVPPVPADLSPSDGADKVSPTTQIRIRLYDFGAGIDLARTDLLVDGHPVPASLEGDPSAVDLRYRPSEPLSGLVDVGYQAYDQASPPNFREVTLGTFLVHGAQILTGDVNGDGRVDGTDLVLLAIHFGAVDGEGRYARFTDLNKDHKIDGSDLAILASHFGESAG